MGLPQVQNKINQMLNGNKVDLIKHFKSNPKRIDIVIYQNGKKTTVDLSAYAGQVKTAIQENKKPLLTTSQVLDKNIDWRDVNKYSDEKLVKNADMLAHAYQSLMANKNDFDKDVIEEATRAYDHIMTRLDVIASPCYYHLDPDVFSKVPSETLTNIASDPQNIKSDEGENQVLDDDALQAYLISVAKNEKVREDLAKAEANESFYAEVGAGFDAITEFKSDIKILNRIKSERNGKKVDDKMTEDEQKKYDEYSNFNPKEIDEELEYARSSIKEKRRTIAGINIALKVIDNDTVLPDFQEFNKYISSKRYNKFVEDITDEQLKDAFNARKRWDILKNLDKLKPIKKPVEKPLEEPIKKQEEVKVEDQGAAAKKWYESFSAQLKAMGLEGNALGLGMIYIRNDIKDSLENYVGNNDLSIEEGYEVLDFYNKAIEPAFLTRNANNEIATKIKHSDSYVDWINTNSYSSFSQVPKEHIEYLYRMAKENKLFMHSANISINAASNVRYFYVNENGESELTETLDKLNTAYKNSKNADKVGPYSRDECKTLLDLDEAAANYEIAVSDVHGNVCYYKFNDVDTDLVKLEQYNNEMANAISRKGISIFALNNPNWASNPQIMREVEYALTVQKKFPKTQTQEELARANKVYVLNQDMDKFQENLLKSLKCTSVDDLLSHVFMDEDHKEIKAGNSFDLMNALCKQLTLQKEFLVDGCPIKSVSKGKIQPSVNKKAYIDEVKYLVSRLKKFEGNLTKNTQQYEDFAIALKGLPGQIGELNTDNLDFENLGNLMDTVVKLGDAYITAHPGKLDSRQVERVKIINRLKDLRKEVEVKCTRPGKKLDYRLAEKIFTAASVKVGNHIALKSEAVREQTISKIMESPDFARIKNLPPEQKKQMLKTSGEKIVKNYFAHENVVKETESVEKNIDLNMNSSM